MVDEDAGVVKKPKVKVRKKRTTRATKKKVAAKKRPARKAVAPPKSQNVEAATESPDEQLSRLKEYELLREGTEAVVPKPELEPALSPNGRIGPMVWGPLLVIGLLVFLIVGEDSEPEKATGAYSGTSSRSTRPVQPSAPPRGTAKRNEQPAAVGLPGAQYWSPDAPGVADSKPPTKPLEPTPPAPIYPPPTGSVTWGAAQPGTGQWPGPAPGWGREGGNRYQSEGLPPPPGASLGMGGGSPWQAMPVPQSAYPSVSAPGTPAGYPPVPASGGQ